MFDSIFFKFYLDKFSEVQIFPKLRKLHSKNHRNDEKKYFFDK